MSDGEKQGAKKEEKPEEEKSREVFMPRPTDRIDLNSEQNDKQEKR